MKELITIIAIITVVLATTFSFIEYSSTKGREAEAVQREKDREMYKECLKLTERLLREDNPRTPFCHL